MKHQDIITVEPRINGKIIECEGVKYPSFSFAASKGVDIEYCLIHAYNTFKAFTGTEDIEVSYSCFNSISMTWPRIAAYYGIEKRFVKF